MPVEIKFEIKNESLKRVEGWSDQVINGFENALESISFLLKAKVQQLIRTSPGGGKTYRRRSITHTSSKPGDPPKTDTGDLIGSIQRRALDPLTVIVGSDQEYAGFLEEGTGKMEARPYLKPALDQERSRMDQLVEQFIDDALSK